MKVKELIILFQEWQLENNVANYNFMHNGIANIFMEKYDLEDLDIPEITTNKLIKK